MTHAEEAAAIAQLERELDAIGYRLERLDDVAVMIKRASSENRNRREPSAPEPATGPTYKERHGD